MEELKACPSCRYNDDQRYPSGNKNYSGRWHKIMFGLLYYIRCWNCNFSTDSYLHKWQAVKEWNRYTNE